MLTFPQLSASLQGRVNRYSWIENASCLSEALLPSHMIGQLTQAVCHTTQVNAPITLPCPPSSCTIVTP